MSGNTNESRRRFLKIGASMILVTSALSANAKVIFKRKSPASKELLEVGLILGAGGHSNGIWGNYLNPPAGEVRRTGMVYTKVWSADPKVAEGFREKYGTEIVKKFDGMIGKVHGMIVDDFYAVTYNYKLARPYLEAGIPTFVNRPYADSMMKARDMVNCARKGNAPLMTGSSWEHLKEVHTVRRKVKLDEITGYEAWNSCSDFYSHGLHGVWWAYATAGGGIEAVSMKSKDWRTCANPHDPEKSSITYVEYKDRGKGPFIGKINEGQMPGIGGNNCAIVFQPENQTHIHHWVDQWGRAEFAWLPMLHRVQWMFETGKLFQTHEEILEKTAMFIAAFHSHLEKGGKMVELDTLPEDWAIGSPYLNEKSKAYIDPYIKLFGEEKGALQPL
ncbi:hypothetical protein ACFL1R_07840 [Candidatus Latescibacterota bacterium]